MPSTFSSPVKPCVARTRGTVARRTRRTSYALKLFPDPFRDAAARVLPAYVDGTRTLPEAAGDRPCAGDPSQRQLAAGGYSPSSHPDHQDRRDVRHVLPFDRRPRRLLRRKPRLLETVHHETGVESLLRTAG